MQYECQVGVFAEIHRAWISFDNRLFVWKSDDDRDFNMWDGLEQVIVSVGLVVPKPGVFVESIRYLLVLTTAVEVVVLGVSFANDDITQEMFLQPTDISIPSDEVNMMQVVGTPEGRILLCGVDGNIYELEYSAPGSGWFGSSKRCRKINHTQGMLGSLVPFLSNLYSIDPLIEMRLDKSRNILYALSASSTIQGYWLGADGRSFHQFASRSQLQNDANVRDRVFTSTEFKISSIWPVTASESSRIHLVAITSSGVRIYLTTTPSPSDKPYALQVAHVDHPLKDMRSRGTHCSVQSAFFAHGCLLLSTSSEGGASLAAANPDGDKPLFCVHFDMGSKERGVGIDEPSATLRLSGICWAIAEVPLPEIVSNAEMNSSLVPPINVANELATQHLIQRRFLCLTNRGIYTVERRRPVDQLIQCLSLSQGNTDAEELRSFFSLYGEAEACAMCLLIACDPTPAATQVREYAASTFLFYSVGGGGGGGGGAGGGGGGGGGPQPLLFGRPQQLSDRYQGFCLYLARLLYPVWQVPINRITVYTKEDVRNFRDALVNLRRFVEQTRWSTGGGPIASSSLAAVGDGGALSADGSSSQQRLPFPARVIESLHARTPNHQEQQALTALLELLGRACQALNMLIVLNEADITIIDRLTSDRSVTSAPFSELVAGQAGQTIIKLLIGFLMKANTEQTDQMSKDLSAACPLYFNQADRDFFLAVKLLREAALQQNPALRSEPQQEALALFRRIAGNMAFQDAFTVISEMQEQGFWAGMVEVAVYTAQGRDKQRPADAEDRARCYGVVARTFEHLLTTTEDRQSAAVVVSTANSGPETVMDLYRRLKRLVLKEGGEECARHLFAWYLSTQRLAELLEIESPLLEGFLRAHDPIFLAEYYTANHRFGDAAAAYLALADLPGEKGGPDLSTRIAYLGNAVANVKQADTHTVAEGQVRLLTEKLEVALIQRRIFNELLTTAPDTLGPEFDRLNGRLFSISELYNQFAWPLQLWETCLIIMYTANHECPRSLVEKIWNSIILQERHALATKSVPAAVASISRKVENVARVSSLSLKVFPVDVISELLEQLSFEKFRGHEGFDPCWVPRLMLSLDVSHNTLFDLYHHFFSSLDGNRPFQLHFSAPLRYVTERWLEAAMVTGRRIPVQVMDEVIVRLEEYAPAAQEEVRAWKNLSQRVKAGR